MSYFVHERLLLGQPIVHEISLWQHLVEGSAPSPQCCYADWNHGETEQNRKGLFTRQLPVCCKHVLNDADEANNRHRQEASRSYPLRELTEPACIHVSHSNLPFGNIRVSSNGDIRKCYRSVSSELYFVHGTWLLRRRSVYSISFVSLPTKLF